RERQPVTPTNRGPGPLRCPKPDVTQVRLLDHSWGYISAIIDEASREVITVIVRNSANKEQLHLTLDDLAKKLPAGVTPIMHSDQGWQYQTREY
ncbi:DDE-type integrase/transposase/recombinase, partial [Lacticaseibacillus paracasei]|uniref:DDE-type integrase/transposase/recombinase n=1 Tax=Lacticaseibacillus paracasei TaxID=1597 RepID=UPI00194F35AC|nr:DDE-type integrase/transposase/recombinase [Lacticaseibacillus paracasei]